MNRYLLALVIALVVLFGATATVTAQPNNGATADGDGPPVDLPGPVPDFVSDLLGAISDFVSGVLTALSEAVQRIVPGVSGGPPTGI